MQYSGLMVTVFRAKAQELEIEVHHVVSLCKTSLLHIQAHSTFYVPRT